jgi:hypothetical protein
MKNIPVLSRVRIDGYSENGEPNLSFSMPELKINEVCSVRTTDSVGIERYIKVTIVKKAEPAASGMPRYLVSYGKKRMSETLPLSALHAGECAS